MNNRSNSQGNFIIRASSDSKKMIRQPPANLITLPKDMYTLFNEFQLTQSRLWSLKEYQYLTQQIINFNKQLKQWKQNNGPQIRNLRLSYYLYQNLYTRIKFVSGNSVSQQSALKSIVQITKWFAQQKPKVRGAPPKKPDAIVRPYQQDNQEMQYLDDMTQYSLRKRQLTAYQMMSRTAHTNFFPPKQRLLDYHKKQFIVDHKLTINGDQVRQSRQARTASQINRLNQQKLGQTRTTFQNTKSKFQKTSSTGFNNVKNSKNSLLNTASNFNPTSATQIKQLKQPQGQQFEGKIQINEFNLNQPNEEQKNGQQKILGQEQILKQMIEQPKYQQDEADDQQQDILQEEEEKSKYKKVYQQDHKRPLASIQVQAQQNIKDQQQSTLRRLLKNKQLQVEKKLQDLNVAEKMGNWARTRSFINEQISRKSQSYRFINDFKKAQYSKKSFFQKRKQIPQFIMKTERSKTAQINSIKNIQKSVQKRNIDNALKSFGRYISSHVRIGASNIQNQQNQEMKLMRATSLTAFNRKAKNKHFGQILTQNQVDIYNDEVNNDVNYLKAKLSKKQIPLNKKKIYSALSAVKAEELENVKVFPKTLSLLSNPFFPKHLYETKKKKKK